MRIDEREASNLFIDLITSDKYHNFFVTREKVTRGYNIERVKDNSFLISIERHPHLLFRTSSGIPSSAYQTVRVTYLFDADQMTINLEDESVIDTNIDYYLLAEEEIHSWFHYSGYADDIEDDLRSIKTKDEALDFATKEFNSIAWMEGISTEDLPDDFEANLLDSLKPMFIERFIEEWKRVQLEVDYEEDEDE